jgi:hypothetical protein
MAQAKRLHCPVHGWVDAKHAVCKHRLTEKQRRDAKKLIVEVRSALGKRQYRKLPRLFERIQKFARLKACPPASRKLLNATITFMKTNLFPFIKASARG